MSVTSINPSLALDPVIQPYIESLYHPLNRQIQQSLFATNNEIYGELYYESVVKLLKYLKVQPDDHFLDIGSGIGRFALQVFLTTTAASVTGIEINPKRHVIIETVQKTLRQQLPDLFNHHRTLNFILDDFLTLTIRDAYPTIVYICSTVFASELLSAISDKINTLPSVKKIASLRKLPTLDNFILTKKIFIQGTWDNSPCYLYTRKPKEI